MKYQPIFEDEFIHAQIKWHKPVPLIDNWAEFSDWNKYNHNNIYFYKFIAIRENTPDPRINLIYIGFSTRPIYERLQDKDHLAKQQKAKKENPGFRFYVCAGELLNPSAKNIKHVKDYETLLIYSHKNTNFRKLINVSNALKHNIIKSIIIENSGYLKDEMYKKVSYGLFHYV
jgi:hypothetical protein